MRIIFLLLIMITIISFSNNGYSELIDNNDGTVTDTETGLMWQKNTGGSMPWEDALSYCENLTLAGKNDWRLPSINELKSIVDYTEKNPAIDTSIFSDTEPDSYWSSTTLRRTGGTAWAVDFEFGHVFPGGGTDSTSGQNKTYYHWFRAVRTID